MQRAMNIEQLLTEVIRQKASKQDRITSTKDNIRLVPAMPGELSPAPKLVLLRDGAVELERYEIEEHAHHQIAFRLEVPFKYYARLMADHPDLLMHQVNALFEREPEMRMIRILDGKVRAFLSDRYLRLDNAEVLEQSLPIIVKGGFQTELLASHVDSQKMNIKVLFTDDQLAHEITTARGAPRVMRPGFRLSNSETGQGAYRIQAFFYDGYCKNGAIYGAKDVFSFERNHMGGRLIEGVDFEVVSNETQQIANNLLASQTRDALAALSDPAKVEKMADSLRKTANSEKAKDPVATVELAIKQLPLRESERNGILETFLRDGDYSQYGLAAAVTEQANSEEKATFRRACELEDIGSQILTMSSKQWSKFANAEAVAA